MEVPLLGQAPAGDKTPEFIEAKTAFLIYITEDGKVAVSTDLNAPIVTERAPTQNELWSAVATIKKDIETSEAAVAAAQLTVSNIPNALVQFNEFMRQQMQNQQLAGQLGLK